MWKVKINNKDIMEKIDPPPQELVHFNGLLAVVEIHGSIRQSSTAISLV